MTGSSVVLLALALVMPGLNSDVIAGDAAASVIEPPSVCFGRGIDDPNLIRLANVYAAESERLRGNAGAQFSSACLLLLASAAATLIAVTTDERAWDFAAVAGTTWGFVLLAASSRSDRSADRLDRWSHQAIQYRLDRRDTDSR